MLLDSTNFLKFPTPRQLVIRAFESVEYNCQAEVDSRLIVKYFWTHNGKPLNSSLYSLNK